MDNNAKLVKEDIVIPPLRNTFSLEISPDQPEISDIARKQLDNLTKPDRKAKRKTPTVSDSEPIPAAVPVQLVQKTPEVKIHDPVNLLPNLSSPIVSKAELENEIRKKIVKQDSIRKNVGAIEIPHELILSGLNPIPSTSVSEEAAQLHDQELIDILEGKSGDENEMFELIHPDGRVELVQSDGKVAIEEVGGTSFDIVSEESKLSETKAKLLEREIAIRQIASLPVRKNKKSTKAGTSKPNQTSLQSLAAEWTDEDEMILEVVNMEDDKGEPKIKILNMTILNETPEVKQKVVSKADHKILNKEAPQNAPVILNINASPGETPATFKRSRVVKKKEIWDPSETKSAAVDKKAIPLNLPPSITIKKLTKESIAKSSSPAELPTVETSSKQVAKKGKKRSEVDKLLQDEGAVNMMYSLERENNNEDVPDIDVKPDQKQLVDKSQEKSLLVTKAKTIKNVVMKQSASPPEVKTQGRGRAKRDQTPVKQEAEVIVKKTPASGSQRKQKKADNCATWDYIYSQTQASCDDAMIIRRHSNSSYSSSAASPRRLSVDINDSFESPPSSANNMKQEAFEFTKPPQKSTKCPADKLLNKDFVDELRGKISNVLTKNKEKPQTITAKGRKRAATQSADISAPPVKRASERRSNGDHKEYRLVKTVTHIIFNQNPLSISVLSEMKTLLNQLEADDCQIVLMTSSEGFSEGLDYSTLVQSTVDNRKQAASDLVTAFK